MMLYFVCSLVVLYQISIVSIASSSSQLRMILVAIKFQDNYRLTVGVGVVNMDLAQ